MPQVKQFFQKSAALLLTGAIAMGTVPTAFAADDTQQGILSQLARYSTGYSDQEGGVAEIVSYNADNGKFYLVNGREKKVDIVSLADLTDSKGQTLTLEKRVDVSGMIEGFSFGDITSVSVDTVNNRVAVAVQAEDYTADGAILLLNYGGEYIASYEAGVQPDMVTFSADGRFVVCANEGEAREGYGDGATDPKGSVTVVDLQAEQPTGNTVTFDSWDAKRDALVNSNVILKKGVNPSTDFEPEYIAVSSDSKTAYVALQEANAIAALDLENGEFTAINSLGFKDHSAAGNEIDVVKDKKINIRNENLMGVYMPDGITTYEVNGKTYLLTANEGDASEWGEGENEYTNMTEIEIDGEAVQVLNTDMLDGLPEQENGAEYLLGGRSFSIYEVTADSLKQVYDSGNDFEVITAEVYPNYFNASNKNNKLDSRSDAKGPEAESVVVTTIGDKTYAYIGLERIGGVMLYDITDPEDAKCCDYINSRDFTVDFPKEGTDPAQGDVSVEGMCVVSAQNSPTGSTLLLAANEVSGTVAVYQHNTDKAITLPFTDVREDDWFRPYVEYVYSNSIMTGTSETTFSPQLTTTRGMLVTMLHSMEGKPETSGNTVFDDVAADAWYADAVEWAVENGIVAGYGSGKFGPNDAITREQMVTILYSYAKYKGCDVSAASDLSGYTDAASISEYAQKAMTWAHAEGLIVGVTENQLMPQGSATRAQTAVIFTALCENIIA